MDYAKSSSGRTIWTIIEGRLHEQSPESMQFTLLAVDTLELLDPLKRNEEGIRKAAEKEVSNAVAQRGR